MNTVINECYTLFLEQDARLVLYHGRKFVLRLSDFDDLIGEEIVDSIGYPCDAILFPYGVYRPL